MTKGVLFDIRRFSVNDGPGIRTTVFFKGCPLSCKWCHNPESRRPGPEVTMRTLTLDGVKFEQEEITGRDYEVDEVVALVIKDRVFYDESGGGVTLSGGEPLYQPDFCEALLTAFKASGLHTALDTCGYAPGDTLERMIPWTDLFLYDIKLLDEAASLEYTGVPFAPVLDNLVRLLDTGKKVILRFPVIPGITDKQKNLDLLKDLLGSLHVRFPRNVPQIQLLPYHTSAGAKYKRLALANPMEGVAAVTKEEIEEIRRFLET